MKCGRCKKHGVTMNAPSYSGWRYFCSYCWQRIAGCREEGKPPNDYFLLFRVLYTGVPRSEVRESTVLHGAAQTELAEIYAESRAMCLENVPDAK